MNRVDVADRLELLGVLAGGFLVVVSFGTLVGTPWTTNNDPLASAVQLVGVAATVAVGLVLVRLSYVRT